MLLAVIPTKAFGPPSVPLSNLLPSNIGANNVLILDQDRPETKSDPASSSAMKFVAGSDLLRGSATNQLVMHRLAVDTPLDTVIVINCLGLEFRQIAQLIQVASAVWFSLEHWHAGMVIMCADLDTLPTANALSSAFTIRPLPLSPESRRRKANGLRRRGLLLRLAGSGRLSRAVYGLFRAIARFRR